MGIFDFLFSHETSSAPKPEFPVQRKRGEITPRPEPIFPLSGRCTIFMVVDGDGRACTAFCQHEAAEAHIFAVQMQQPEAELSVTETSLVGLAEPPPYESSRPRRKIHLVVDARERPVAAYCGYGEAKRLAANNPGWSRASVILNTRRMGQ